MHVSFAERWHSKAGNRATHLVACAQDLLPESAAPCVNFEMAARPKPLWEVFGSPRSWPPADRERLELYRMIGSDGAGNPICREQLHGTVVLLDHEDHFHTCQFVNSTVAQLAECLLAYMDEHDAERFRAAVRRIDSEALSEGSFWTFEAAWLDVETEQAPGAQQVNLHGVREDYLLRFHDAMCSYRQSGRTVCSEICLDISSAVRRHPFYRLFVVDVLERLPDGETKVIEINVEPIAARVPGLLVDAPLAWNGIEFRCEPEGFPDASLIAWGERWINDENPPYGRQNDWSGVIHSVTEPALVDGHIQFSVDFGSAPLAAFYELRDILSGRIRSIGSYALTT